MAFGAGKNGRLTVAFIRVRAVLMLSDFRTFGRGVLIRLHGLSPRTLAGQLNQLFGDVTPGQNVVGSRVLDCSSRHLADQRRCRVFDDRDAPSSPNREQTRRTIVQVSAEQKSYQIWPEGSSRSSKQRIDSGTMPILPRTTFHSDFPRLERQMTIRRGNIDFARDDFVAIFGMNCWEWGLPRQNLREITISVRREMNYNEDGYLEPRRQMAGYFYE